MYGLPLLTEKKKKQTPQPQSWELWFSFGKTTEDYG